MVLRRGQGTRAQVKPGRRSRCDGSYMSNWRILRLVRSGESVGLSVNKRHVVRSHRSPDTRIYKTYYLKEDFDGRPLQIFAWSWQTIPIWNPYWWSGYIQLSMQRDYGIEFFFWPGVYVWCFAIARLNYVWIIQQPAWYVYPRSLAWLRTNELKWPRCRWTRS